ncbi:MAG: hypothetical protein ACRC2R_02495 [Xenococcaceae cyanobacterium]
MKPYTDNSFVRFGHCCALRAARSGSDRDFHHKQVKEGGQGGNFPLPATT